MILADSRACRGVGEMLRMVSFSGAGRSTRNSLELVGMLPGYAAPGARQRARRYQRVPVAVQCVAGGFYLNSAVYTLRTMFRLEVRFWRFWRVENAATYSS